MLRYLQRKEEGQHHFYWRAHAYCMSRQLMSPLPSDILYLILRLVPSFSYMSVYSPEPPQYDCEEVYDCWSFPDLDQPRAFGDY